MLPIAILQFTWPTGLWIALALAVVTIMLGAIRRIALPRTSAMLIAIGMILLALACGAPVYRGHDRPKIAVLVDVSPSTRGAGYLERERLRHRITELLGTRSFRLYAFGDSMAEIDLSQPLVEQPADRTNFTPPPADAVVLFSDARFDLPATAPPTFVVVDPLLERPQDAAVTKFSIDHDDVTIAVRNHTGSPNDVRRLAVNGVQSSAALPIGETLGDGDFIFHANADPNADEIVAGVVGTDRWPENDQMRIVAPPPSLAQRWWISGDGRAAPDSTWRALSAKSLPLDAETYLAPSVIVLDDVPADALSAVVQQRIARYVRDLGGSLIIGGGEHAFGAGGYFGTTLDALSPLSSAPPAPMRHWILLADSSGSMASAPPGDTQTKWQRAVEALLRALPSIPTNDLVTTGSFARDVRWWSAARSVDETRRMMLPPADVTPNGPTNLQPALEQIASRADQMPTEVLVLSDADTTITNPETLARQLADKKIRIHLLATGSDPAQDNPVSRIVRATGGQQFREADPTRWSARMRELLQAAMPDLLGRGSATITFNGSVNLPPRAVQLWNRVWVKADTQPLALIRENERETAGGAQWNLGTGRVAALAFPANSQELSTFAPHIERPPRDPRFSVTREEGADVHLTVDAVEKERYLNDLSLQLSLRDDSESALTVIAFTQAAPGRYELSTPTPRSSTIATITLDGKVIDRFALAGRYPREFAGIGNDRQAMGELARRTGGRVIEPDDARPLEIIGAARQISLTSEAAFAGAGLVAIGLIHWRRTT